MDHNARIDETVRDIYAAFEHPGKHPLDTRLASIDNWIAALDGLGGAGLMGVLSQLRTLRGHMEHDDRLAAAASLQRLGQDTSLMARDLHGGTGDHLRHLGQALIIAAGNLKAS